MTTNKKVIHYIRHGESLANEAIREALAAAGLTGAKNQFAGEARKVSYDAMNSPANFDAGLSSAGIKQARALAAGRAISGGRRPSDVELIVASSLTRAIHTAALVFPKAGAFPYPILCLDETREFAGPSVNLRTDPPTCVCSRALLRRAPTQMGAIVAPIRVLARTNVLF